MSETDTKKTVLVVDDTTSNIQTVNTILKDCYKVRIATSGSNALELVKVAPAPDLVLLDVMMPDMDGYEVCTQLKADWETRDIPIIFLTRPQSSRHECTLTCCSVAFDDHCRMTALLDKVNHVCSRPHTRFGGKDFG